MHDKERIARRALLEGGVQSQNGERMLLVRFGKHENAADVFVWYFEVVCLAMHAQERSKELQAGDDEVPEHADKSKPQSRIDHAGWQKTHQQKSTLPLQIS